MKLNKIIILALIAMGLHSSPIKAQIQVDETEGFDCYTHTESGDFTVFLGESKSTHQCLQVVIANGGTMVFPHAITEGEEPTNHASPLDCTKAVPFD